MEEYYTKCPKCGSNRISIFLRYNAYKEINLLNR